eukprot:gene55065-22418_t
MKQMSETDMQGFRNDLNIPLTDEQLKDPDRESFCVVAPDSAER